MAAAVQSTLTPPQKPKRHYYLDWIRVLAVAMLLFYHVSRIFESRMWLINSPAQSPALEQLNLFIDTWHMPLLFLVSGMSSFLALSFRSSGIYLRERFRRLFVPLIFGLVVLIPPQIYYETLERAATNPDQASPGSLLSFYPYILNWMVTDGRIRWEHLWFLEYLLIYSLVGLPLFLWLKTQMGQRLIAWLGNMFAHKTTLFLLAVPLVLLEIGVRVVFPALTANVGGGIGRAANFIRYQWDAILFFVVFLYGFLLIADSRFGIATKQAKWIGVVGGVLAAGVMLLAPIPFAGALYVTCHALSLWCWVIAAVGFAQTYLTASNRVLHYASELVYPFYIIHQTVIVVVGYYIVQWNMNIPVAFVVISLVSLLLSVGLCELVKQTNVTRFLFGMNAKKPRPAAGQSATVAQPSR